MMSSRRSAALPSAFLLALVVVLSPAADALPQLAAVRPDAAEIPSPEEFFGFSMGTAQQEKEDPEKDKKEPPEHPEHPEGDEKEHEHPEHPEGDEKEHEHPEHPEKEAPEPVEPPKKDEKPPEIG